MKFVLILTVVLALSSTSLADTKVLQKINIADSESASDSIISLNNANTDDAELIIEGSYSQTLYGTDVAPYQLITVYIADKNGYVAKFTLEPGSGILVTKHLTPKSLQSLAG